MVTILPLAIQDDHGIGIAVRYHRHFTVTVRIEQNSRAMIVGRRERHAARRCANYTHPPSTTHNHPRNHVNTRVALNIIRSR